MKWRIIKQDGRYTVKDLTLDGLTVSHTTLHPNQSTKGHSHPHREAYHFLSVCDVRIGSEWETVYPGDIRVVPRNFFHQVSNKGEAEVEFYAIFSGLRGESKYKVEVQDYLPPFVELQPPVFTSGLVIKVNSDFGSAGFDSRSILSNPIDDAITIATPLSETDLEAAKRFLRNHPTLA